MMPPSHDGGISHALIHLPLHKTEFLVDGVCHDTKTRILEEGGNFSIVVSGGSWEATSSRTT